jgi:predicted RNase H-like HicB family nuclease
MNAEYVVVIEKSETGFGAYVPDLPGCVAVGETREEALALIREAIELHVESLRESGEPVPPPTSTAERVAVHVAA